MCDVSSGTGASSSITGVASSSSSSRSSALESGIDRLLSISERGIVESDTQTDIIKSIHEYRSVVALIRPTSDATTIAVFFSDDYTHRYEFKLYQVFSLRCFPSCILLVPCPF